MNKSKKHFLLEVDGKNTITTYKELRKKNNSIDSMVKLREIFTGINLLEAKEIMIISETEFDSLNDYQKEILSQIADSMK